MIDTFKELDKELKATKREIDRYLVTCSANTSRLLAENAAPEDMQEIIRELIIKVRSLFLTENIDYWVYSSVTFFLLSSFGIADILEQYDIRIFCTNIEKMREKGLLTHDEQLKALMVSNKIKEVIDEDGK